MIALIVAYAANRVIGNEGKIPWRIRGEQRRFRELTTGNVVVMGRRSYEEIGHALPDRMIYVVSRTKNFNQDGVMTITSLKDAIRLADGKDIFVSGGAKLYEEAIPIVEKMYITEIGLDVEGDTYFPFFDTELFDRTIDEEIQGDLPYKYVTYTRKSPVVK